MAPHLIMSASYNALLAILLYILDKKTAFSKTPYKLKQVIIGVLFGLMAIFATTTFGGFDIGDGTIMNVRDAAPLCAGLIFGAPAGIISGLIGGIFDFVVATVGLWREAFTSRVCAWGTALATKAKLVFSINTGAAVLGLGYIVGLKYACIIAAGSAVVWFVIVPLLPLLGDTFLQSLNPAITDPIASMEPEVIFTSYARHIGIGGIAMAGILGIIKSWPVIKSAVGLAGRELKGSKNNASAQATPRTQRDLPMKIVVGGVVVALIAVFMFFYFGVMDFNLLHAVVGILVVGIIAFLFTTVAANAIAIVGSNPVSGMTLMTLIIASAIFVGIGLSGTSGIVASMVIGGVVCTALSMAGGFVTDLKIGYWLGSTPRKQETWKFLGTLVSAATVGGVILVLNKVYGFTGDDALVAPQANAMAKVIEPLMMGGDTPWILYFVGAILALLLNWLGVPALAFCLGMFIPLPLNTPMLVGGAIAYFVAKSTKDEALSKARHERGTLISSGLIAGGALFGVFAAITKFAGFEYTSPLSEGMSQSLGLVAYALLICYLMWDSRRAKA